MTTPAKSDQYLQFGNELLGAGRFEEAGQAYRCALEQAPLDADALCNLGIAEMQLGHWAPSAEATRRYLKLHDDDEKAWVRLGMCRKETGDLEGAREALERAIGLAGDDAVAWKELGVCCMAEGKAEEAIGAFRRALAVKPLYMAARCELGRVHEQLGQYGVAMRLYMEGLQATPSAKRGPLYGRLAMLLARQGHWAEARAAYHKAISKGESDPRLPFGLGIACLKLGQLPEAREQRLILAALGSDLAERLARELDKADPAFAQKAAQLPNGHSAAAAPARVEPPAAPKPAPAAEVAARISRPNGSAPSLATPGATPGAASPPAVGSPPLPSRGPLRAADPVSAASSGASLAAKADFKPQPKPPQVKARRPSARAQEPAEPAPAAEAPAILPSPALPLETARWPSEDELPQYEAPPPTASIAASRIEADEKPAIQSPAFEPAAPSPEPAARAAAADAPALQSDLATVPSPTLDLGSMYAAELATAAESPCAELDAEAPSIAESIAAAADAAQGPVVESASEPDQEPAANSPSAEPLIREPPIAESTAAEAVAAPAADLASAAIEESTITLDPAPAEAAAESESTIVLPGMAPLAEALPFPDKAPPGEATMALPLSAPEPMAEPSPEPIPESIPEPVPEQAAAQSTYPADAPPAARSFDEGPTAQFKPQARSWFGRFAGTRSNRGLALGVEARLDAPHERAGESVLAEIFPPHAEIGRAYSMRFALEDPRQRSIHIEVIQGKPLAPVAKCRVVTAFDLPIAPRTSPEANIEIVFVRESDEEIVRITVRDLISGVESQASASLGA